MAGLAKDKITIKLTKSEFQTIYAALFDRRYSIKEDLACGESNFIALKKTEKLISKFKLIKSDVII